MKYALAALLLLMGCRKGHSDPAGLAGGGTAREVFGLAAPAIRRGGTR